MLEGKPLSQDFGAFQGRAEAFSGSSVEQPARVANAEASKAEHTHTRHFWRQSLMLSKELDRLP